MADPTVFPGELAAWLAFYHGEHEIPSPITTRPSPADLWRHIAAGHAARSDDLGYALWRIANQLPGLTSRQVVLCAAYRLRGVMKRAHGGSKPESPALARIQSGAWRTVSDPELAVELAASATELEHASPERLSEAAVGLARYAALRLTKQNTAPKGRPPGSGDGAAREMARRYFAGRVLRWREVCAARATDRGDRTASFDAALNIVAGETAIPKETLRAFVQVDGSDLHKVVNGLRSELDRFADQLDALSDAIDALQEDHVDALKRAMIDVHLARIAAPLDAPEDEDALTDEIWQLSLRVRKKRREQNEGIDRPEPEALEKALAAALLRVETAPSDWTALAGQPIRSLVRHRIKTWLRSNGLVAREWWPDPHH